MTIFTLLSSLAALAASIPALYFAVKMRGQNPPFSRLSTLLALALLVHGGYHFAEWVLGTVPLVDGIETVSALLILAFGVRYWTIREADARA